LAVDPPALSAPPVGHVPAAFRSEPAADSADVGDAHRIGLGALSLSAVLAIALAALRGAAGVFQDVRQRRLERAAEAEPLRRARLKLAQTRAEQAALGTGSTGADAGRGRVPSSHEWGNRAHRGGPGGADPAALEKAKRRTAQQAAADKMAVDKQKAKIDGQAAARKQAGKGADARRSAADRKAGGVKDAAADRKSGGADPVALEKAKRRTAQQAAADKMAVDKQKARLDGQAAARKRLDREHKAEWKPAKDGKAKPGKDHGHGGGKDDAGGGGRVTLGKAIGDEAYRRAEERLRARRESPEPFVRRDRKNDDAEETGGAEDGPKTPEKDTEAGKANESIDAEETGGAEDGPKTPEKDTEAGKANESTTGGEGAADGPADAAPGGAASGDVPGPGSPGPDAGPGGGWVPPPRGERRGADEAMYDATAEERVTVTVEWPDRPAGPAPGREPAAAVTTGVRGLPRTPHRPAGRRPGTTSTITTMKGAPVSTPSIRLPSVAAEHMTDVTLDDVLDHLAASKKDAFATYDECARLADKARHVQRELNDLAEELRRRHNIVGRLTSRAMVRLAESMDLLARKAQQMRTESLRASESVEVAHDEMHDAYRPVQQAAADAGLLMPSARIHNED